MLTGAGALVTIALRLRDAVAARLAVLPDPPDRSYVTTGAVAWDECECGELVVSVTRTYLSATFPGEPGSATVLPPCELPYRVADLTVSLVRCAPNPDDRGVVDAAALTASSAVVLRDAWAALAGVVCIMDDMQGAYDVSEHLVREQALVGPEGGCAGSTLRVTVGLANVCPCEV